ncbi:immunoglobulin superfamily member 5 isoform X1 [Otolemur garnettii]|uniref:immunoglobulin superfamily member 5 isoform X1 n=1 Tax=Otolemur garnettii TaxID=30611 RepID=UPI00027420E8|nr:immunoglobulin superfamily member 5 isoform X1 [Otolemur garnettii]
MQGSWRAFLTTLGVLAGLAALGSSYQILEGPKNVTVLQGSEARFNCTVSPGWKLIMWALHGTVVLSVTPTESIITNNRFTSESYDVGGDFVSEMVIHSVQLNDSGQVKCSLQNSDRDEAAFLSVQVMGELFIPGGSPVVIEDRPCNVTCRARGWTLLPEFHWVVDVPVSLSSSYSVAEPGDLQSAVSILALTPQGNGTLTCVATLRSVQASKSATVNLTVVPPPPESIDKASLPTWAIILLAVSFSLLLILIIILIIIFCCCCASGRENKESSYQSEIRKSAAVKTNTGPVETKLKSGNENYGYSSDDWKSTEIASPPPKSQEVSVLEQSSRSNHYQEIDMQRSGPASHPQVLFHLSSPKKVRNVTLV